MPQQLTEEEIEEKYKGYTVSSQVEEEAAAVVDSPETSHLSDQAQSNLIKKRLKQAATAGFFPPLATGFDTSEEGTNIFDPSLAEQLPERAVNAAQGGRFGSLFGPAGTVGGAAAGFRMQPSGNELESDLPAFMVELGFGRLRQGAGMLGRVGKSALVEAAAVGSAVQAVSGAEDQTLLQAGGSLLGSGVGKAFRTFSSAGKKLDPDARISSSAPDLEIVEGLEAIRQLSPDESIKLMRDAGFEVPATALQEFGKPSQSESIVNLIFRSGGGEQTLKDFGRRQDRALSNIAENTFGKPLKLEDPRRVFNTLSGLGVTEKGSLKFGDKVVATLSPTQLGIYKNLFGSGKSFDDIGTRLLKPGQGGTAGLEGIEVALKVARKVDPGFEQVLRRSMFESLWGRAQKALTKESAGAVDVTQGSKFFSEVSKMDPRKLKAAFGEQGSAALMNVAKVADAIDPSVMYKGTDLAEANFVLTKMGFTAASLTAGAGLGAASSFGGEDPPSSAEVVTRAAMGGLAGIGMFIGLGNLMAKAVTSEGTAKTLNRIADSDVGSNKWATGVRELITNAFAEGEVAKDDETGAVFLYPYTQGNEPDPATNPNSAIQDMMLQGNIL